MGDVVVDTSTGRYAAIDFTDGTAGTGGAGRPDVLMLHQIASSAQVWGTLGPALAEFSRPVALDLCGHGRTQAREETRAHLVRDLPEAVEALGLRDPVVVLESEELLPLFPDRFAGIGAAALLVVGPFTSARGAVAASEYEEILGPGSIDDWDAKNSLFVSGTAADRAAFVDGRVAKARADWVNEGVPEEQHRRYVERQLRDTAAGWERVPRRPLVEEALDAIGRGPFGLDLYDGVAVPVWLAIGGHGPSDEEVDDFCAWARESESRRAAFIPGHAPPDSFRPGPFADLVRELLDEVRRGRSDGHTTSVACPLASGRGAEAAS